MSINTNDLNAEREVLVKDFEALQQRIKQNSWGKFKRAIQNLKKWENKGLR